MLKITERDENIIKFLKDFKVADTNTISKIFFNGKIRVTQNRLKKLKDNKFINSDKTYYSYQNIFYVKKKPSQIRHSLLLSQFIGELYAQNLDIEKYKVSLKICDIIVDCFIVIKVDDYYKMFFIEVENTKNFDLEKYLRLKEQGEFKSKFPVMPVIVVITDKKIKVDDSLNIIKIKIDFSDINKLIETLKE
ncbi:TPA: hypothetical protein KOT48_003679 [Clostridioides difficile]|nr:hypothetical protein [Clostridioides difficile]